MKLQKRLSRIYKSKKYYKYILVIPEKEIEKAKFKEGNRLEAKTKEGEIKIKKSKS